MPPKSERSTHRSSKGRKLYAVRDKEGRFKDIRTYKRAHGADIKRKSNAGSKSAEGPGSMPIKIIELEMDAVAKLEAAKWSSDESLSAVVRRAQFPGKPHVARALLADFEQRAGRSTLSEEALNRLEEVQKNPARSSSHWD